MDTIACAKFALALIREGDGNLTPAQSERVAMSLDDLIALAEGLPKLGCGTPAVPNAMCWCWWDGDVEENCISSVSHGLLELEVPVDSGEVFDRDPRQCYSTRELAERYGAQ